MLRAASAFGGAVSWAAMATFESVAHFVAAIDVPVFNEDVGVGTVPPLRHDAVAELHSGRGYLRCYPASRDSLLPVCSAAE
jgi:hypothetical protein